jgi:hypothetical protein
VDDARAWGAGGELRYGYQQAAVLGAWRLLGSRTVEAAVLRKHDVWADCRPLTLRLRMGGVTWEWVGVEPAFDGAAVRVAVNGIPSVSVGGGQT